MIADKHPLGAVCTDGVRAGATLRWLRNSGPSYQEKVLVLDKVVDGIAYLIPPTAAGNGGKIKIGMRQMSFAAWHQVAQANPGDFLNLKVRTDPVGHPIT